MIAKIIAILTLIGMAFTVHFWTDARYARCADVKALERRMDIKIEGDVLNQREDRLFKLKERYGFDPAKITDPVMKRHILELQSDVEEQRSKVRQLEAK